MEFHKVKKGILKLIPQPRLSSFVITPNFDPLIDEEAAKNEPNPHKNMYINIRD